MVSKNFLTMTYLKIKCHSFMAGLNNIFTKFLKKITILTVYFNFILKYTAYLKINIGILSLFGKKSLKNKKKKYMIYDKFL